MRNVDGVSVGRMFLRGLLFVGVFGFGVGEARFFFFLGDGVSLTRFEDVEEVVVRPRRGVRFCNCSFGDIGSSSAGSSNGVSPARRSFGMLRSFEDG